MADVLDNFTLCRDKIFKNVYKARVPYLASLDDDDIEMYGIPYLGDAQLDNQMRNQLIERYLTINDMVELRRRGCPIYVIMREDTKVIYDTIVEYLSYWTAAMDYKLNNLHVPHQDLLDLDELALVIFPYAKTYHNTKIATMFTENNFTLFPNTELVKARPNNGERISLFDVAEKVEELEHASFHDKIVQSQSTNKRAWTANVPKD